MSTTDTDSTTDSGDDDTTNDYNEIAVEPGDEINSRDEANAAVLEHDLVLRVQPKAPAPTHYYWMDDDRGWVYRKAGHKYANEISVEKVRETVDRHIPKNSRNGGGGVRAAAHENLY
jgi:hypothetical protein